VQLQKIKEKRRVQKRYIIHNITKQKYLG
jgi:hypothetical protein